MPTTPKTVVLVDCGLSHTDTLRRALEECGARVLVTNQPTEILHSPAIVLPDSRSFASSMAAFRKHGLVEALNETVSVKKIPILGIGLGMQLLAKRHIDTVITEGLGWIAGDSVRLRPHLPTEHNPHMGWNELRHDARSPLLKDIPPSTDFYFQHGDNLRCDDPTLCVATTPYAGGCVGAIGHNRIWGVQFRPEKSQKYGFQLLRNFLTLTHA